MATTAKQLRIGDLVEIDGRQYDVVSDNQGGVTLEPAITKTIAEIDADHDEQPLSTEEFRRLFGPPLPSDGEG